MTLLGSRGAPDASIEAARAAIRERRLSEGTSVLDRVGEALHAPAVSDPAAFTLGQDMRRHLLRALHEVLGPYRDPFVKRSWRLCRSGR